MGRTLLLTSAGLPKETRDFFLDLLTKPPERSTVCFIPTAADPEKDKWFVVKAKNEIKEIGMKLKEVDLKNETKVSLLRKFSKCDVIYVNGGNTFYLLDWIRKSGFDRIIPKLLKMGKIYVGSSAGSYITCPTIEQATWKHQDRNKVGLTDLTALNLVPFLITAHFEEKYRPLIEKAAKTTKYPIVVLNDTQAILVENNLYKLVGKGKKIFLNFKKKDPSSYFFY